MTGLGCSFAQTPTGRTSTVARLMGARLLGARALGGGRAALLAALLLVSAGSAEAQGHGPIYGLSTPTLGQGGWSLDVGTMARVVDGGGTLMLRPMLSYGITEDLQAFGSVPLPVVRDASVPAVRGFTRMPATHDVEVGLGWRPHRSARGVGSRFETTIWAALALPLDESRRGLATSPGAFGSLVTGYASRSLYVWVGGAYRRYAVDGGDRPGDTRMASLVLGYRPPFLREDYPSPDWRGFVEVVGEWTGEDRLDGAPLDGSGGHQVYLALTALGLYGSWGIAGGPAFPLSQTLNGTHPEERVRFALNLTFWW